MDNILVSLGLIIGKIEDIGGRVLLVFYYLVFVNLLFL